MDRARTQNCRLATRWGLAEKALYAKTKGKLTPVSRHKKEPQASYALGVVGSLLPQTQGF